jgi:hypothetical protein
VKVSTSECECDKVWELQACPPVAMDFVPKSRLLSNVCTSNKADLSLSKQRTDNVPVWKRVIYLSPSIEG